jgi:hypothetical protein
MIRRIVVLALLVLGACDKSDGLPPTVSINASEVDGGSAATASGRKRNHLEWPSDFALWKGAPIKNGAALPPCPSAWFEKRLDDEYTAWKCSNYPDPKLGVGELVVHSAHGKIFTVTTTMACTDPNTCAEERTKLLELNKDRNVPVPTKHAKVIANVWNLKTYFVALSAVDLGFSMRYFDSIDDLGVHERLVDQQNDPPRLDKFYTLGQQRYRMKSIAPTDSVGRGKDRWSAKQDSVFVVVSYVIENRSHTVLQDDPSDVVLVAKDKIYSPDVKAEDYYLRADKTGLFITPLDYKSQKPRFHVFEVKRQDMARSALVVLSQGDQKLVYQIN